MTAHIAARLATIRTLLERSADHCGYVHGEDRALTIDLRMALAELSSLTTEVGTLWELAAKAMERHHGHPWYEDATVDTLRAWMRGKR